MEYVVKMTSYGMLYIPSFMKVGTCFEGILRFCLRNLKCCNVGITDDRDLRSGPVEMSSDGMICALSSMSIGSII
jgi:hypothetical protein